MARDFSWLQSAGAYQELYLKLQESRRFGLAASPTAAR
jgi:hypothetical protein